MAKPGLTTVDTDSDTFQVWIDRTNEIVEVFQTDVITATSSGDSTTGNATLVGSFTANTITATTSLKADTIAPRTSASAITIDTRVNINSTAAQQLQTLTNSNGPRTRYATGSTTWDVGYKDNTDNEFVIDSSQDGGTYTFELTTDGDLTIPGTLTAGSFSGTLTGTVSSLSNFTTDDLDEGADNQYYTTARATEDAKDAISIQSPANGLTYSDGVIGTDQDLSTSSNITFESLKLRDGSTGDYYSDIVNTGSSDGENSLIIKKTGEDVIKITRDSGSGVNSTNIYGLTNVRDHPTDTSSLGNLIVSSGDNTQGTIIATGDITAFGSVSDRRKKQNIEPITNALNKVMSIGGYTFNYYNDDRRMTGVIAQELLEVLPEVVYETEDPENNSMQYAVRHGNIVGLLIEAIKELKAEVEELKNK